jgi:hypothetical protein
LTSTYYAVCNLKQFEGNQKFIEMVYDYGFFTAGIINISIFLIPSVIILLLTTKVKIFIPFKNITLVIIIISFIIPSFIAGLNNMAVITESGYNISKIASNMINVPEPTLKDIQGFNRTAFCELYIFK